MHILNKLSNEGLIRHINGNTYDNRRQNLQKVNVMDTLRNKDWIVDAVCILNDEEFIIWHELRKSF